jgi:hypothetical protein
MTPLSPGSVGSRWAHTDVAGGEGEGIEGPQAKSI